MREEDMRCGKYIDEKQEVHRKCTEELVKRSRDFVTVPCPACGEEKWDKSFDKGGFQFVTCQKCETTYINPRPTFDMLMDYQKASHEASRIWVEKIYPLSEETRRQYIFKPRAQKVVDMAKKYNCSMGKIVDVGAGYGTFGEELVNLNIFDEVAVVESGALTAKSCRNKGLNVIEMPIEEANLKNVDIITNFELIEHLFNPREFILSCKKSLSKKGLFVLTTPNSKGFDVFMLGSLSGVFQGPLHLNYFHPDSIRYLLENCGFEVVEVRTPGLLDAELVRKRILSGELNVDNSPFMKKVLVEEWDELGEKFQKFLADNGLSSHMMAVAKNVG